MPKLATAGWSFQKFNRRAQDWAIVGVAAVRANGHTGVALVNMGSTPLVAAGVVDAVAGGATAAEAAERATEGTEPQGDLNAIARVPRAPRPRARAPGPRGVRALLAPGRRSSSPGNGSPASSARRVSPRSRTAATRSAAARTAGSSRRAGSMRAGLRAHARAQAAMSASAS